MPADHAEQPWAIRSTLIAVSDLDRSVAFYQELGPFDVIAREQAVAVLGKVSPAAVGVILRQTERIDQGRQGQQSLGLRSEIFNLGSLAELDRIESFLRGRRSLRRPSEQRGRRLGLHRRTGPGQLASGVRLLRGGHARG